MNGAVLVFMVLLLALGLQACSPDTSSETDAHTERQALAEAMRTSLSTDLYDRFYPLAVDTEYGGFLSHFGYDWEVMPGQEKMIVTQARHVWTAAKAADFFPDQRKEYLAMAAQGVAFMRDKMWDEEYGGFVSYVSREGDWLQTESAFTQGKTAYGNAFAIYGLAAYHEASGDAEALAMAQEAFRWLDEHIHDPVHGGYFQFMERDGTPLKAGWEDNPPKDQNSSIHLLEAFTELYHVWPDPVLRDRLEEMLLLIRDTITTDPGYLQLFFDAEWNAVSYRDSSAAVREANYGLDHVSFGHDVETAYLMLEAAHALGLDPAPTLAVGKQMVDHTLAYGWDDQRGGIYDGSYYIEPGKPPTVILPHKTWWSQAEMMNTMLLMADLYPDDEHRYYERFQEMWTYIQQNLIDAEHGGWYTAGLDSDPERRTAIKGNIWKSAYHDGRALMNCIEALER